MSAIVGVLQKIGLYTIAKKIFRGVQSISPSGRKQKRAMLDFYSQFIKKDDICFDIGANVGDRTASFLACGAKVIAVDPQPVCVEHLKKRFMNNHQVVLVEKAMGDKPGEAEMLLSDADTISSLSPEWIEKVKASGRFSDYEWNKSIKVPVTTMDQLISDYGLPAFCKIDVEGFEYQVLQGLSQPVKVISFEFTPEFKDATFKCIKRLDNLGKAVFNFAVGEVMALVLDKWMTAGEMTAYLNQVPDHAMFGDVYAKFQ